MSRGQRTLAALVIVAVLAALSGWATVSAFSTTASNDGNAFQSGTVNLADNDAGAAMYDVANQKPGDTVTRCIKVTYSGSLDSTVKLYASSVEAVGAYVDLTVTPGSGDTTFPRCTGFVADAGGDIYTGTLKGFADTHNSYETGLADNPGAATKWATNDAVVYRLVLTLQDNNAANGGATALSTGPHSFTWQARPLS